MHRGGVPGGILQRTDFRISAETYRAACRCGVFACKKTETGACMLRKIK